MNQHYLEKILFNKNLEVEKLLNDLTDNVNHPIHDILTQTKQSAGIFSAALRHEQLAIIAEIKRKSPSRGKLASIADPAHVALQYCQGGASAISVLTDSHFDGSLQDLQQIVRAVTPIYPHIPILRKDFIIHPIQIAEAAYAGASCILLIAKILKTQLGNFITEATRLGLETLTEIHNEEELHYALDANAPIIGINHRNLDTFTMDFSISENLRSNIPKHVITVAESGIKTTANAQFMRKNGYDAILVSEALVTASCPKQLIAHLRVS